LFSTGWF